MWRQVIPNDQHNSFFSMNLRTWLTSNLCCCTRLPRREIAWSYLFRIIVWCIWKNRNLFIFQCIFWSILKIVKISYTWAQQYEFSHYRDKSNVCISSSSNTLSENWVHLFTDGTVDRRSEATSAGGVLQG